MQLEKTYKGDDRFKLTEDFDVSFADANKGKRHMPDVMIGSLNKREQELLKKKVEHEPENDNLKIQINNGGYESLDDEENGEICWSHDINLDKEKEGAFHILS